MNFEISALLDIRILKCFLYIKCFL